MKRYVIAMNVNDSSELPQASKDIQAFIDTLGQASEMEIQVSVNPLLSEPTNTYAIGYHASYESGENEYEEELYPEEDRLIKIKKR